MKLIVVALLLLPLAGCIEEIQSFEEVQAPEWRAGYTYSYEIEGSFAASAVAKMNGEVVDEGGETEDLPREPESTARVLSTKVAAGATPMYLLAEVLEPEVAGLGSRSDPYPAGVRASDLHWVDAAIEQGKIVYGALPAEIYLNFPLHAGKSWTHTIPNDSEDDDLVGDLVQTSTVIRTENVDGPGGARPAVRVETRLTAPDMAGNVAMLEDALRESGAQNVNIDLGFDAFATTHYAPSIQNVVRERVVVDIDLRMRFTADGDNYDVRSQARVDLTRYTVAAHLVPAPDLGMQGAIQFYESGTLEPITGAIVPAADYTLQIVQDVREVNAGNSEAVTFSAEVVRGSMPATDTLALRVVDVAGTTVANGTDSLTFAPEKPGVYALVARGENAAGELQSVAASNLIADFTVTVPLNCPPVVVEGATACTAFAFDVPAGIETGVFRIQSTAGGAAGVPGDFRIHRPGGVTEARATAGSVTATMATFAGSDLDASWRVQWHPDAGPVQQGTMTVDLDYGTPDVEGAEAMLVLLAGLDVPHIGNALQQLGL